MKGDSNLPLSSPPPTMPGDALSGIVSHDPGWGVQQDQEGEKILFLQLLVPLAF